MKKINFENAPSTNTPLSAEILNQMQDNMEETGVVIRATEPTTNEKVWLRKSNNLFNVNNYAQDNVAGYPLRNICEVGKEYTISLNNNPGGVSYGLSIVGYSGNTMTSDMYEKFTTYSVTFTYTQAMYDNDYKLFIISNGNYSPISKETAEGLNIMLQQGTTATGFEPYAEKAIYTKNSNSGYDEFDNNKTYIITGAECATNEYLDGDRVYVKRVDCGYLNAGVTTTPHNITNLKSLIRYKGTYKNEISGALFNIPRSSPQNPASYNVDCDISKDNITITSGTAYTGVTFKAYIEVYYTKN